MTENSGLNNIATGEKRASDRPTSDHSNDVALDWESLCDRCMGNLDLLQRVLDKFETRLPEELVELERVLELGDAAKIALVAHRIKGNSSNVSAGGLQQAAADIEDLSRTGQVGDIPAHFEKLREEWRRYVACRDALRPTLSTGRPAAARGSPQCDAGKARDHGDA